jgi:low temperature requirement protein LtrA
VVMRVALVFLWSQVARHDPARRPAAHTYMATIGTAQAGWIILTAADVPVGTTFLLTIPLFALELAGPRIAERKADTPWHPHHIAERYGLLVIITLGEVILGTVAALNALVHGEAGWTVDAATLAVAGVGLTFGCWWMYFAIPWAEPLVRHRRRSLSFGYGHLAIFAPLAAMGAGLHVAAYELEGVAKISQTATVLSVVIPVAIFVLVLYGLYAALFRTRDPFHLWLLAGTTFFLVAPVALVAAGVGMTICLIVLALAPVVTIVGYETLGHRHLAEVLREM